MKVQLSSQLILWYNFSSTAICSYFLRLIYRKSEVELWGQIKVMEGKVAEETVVEGPIVERFTNEKNGSRRNS